VVATLWKPLDDPNPYRAGIVSLFNPGLKLRSLCGEGVRHSNFCALTAESTN